MLLDLETIRKSILKKIEEKNFQFDDNERYVFNIDSDIRIPLFDSLKANPELFSVEVFNFIDRFSNVENDVIEDSIFLMLYFKRMIDVGYFNIFGEEARDFFNEEEYQELVDYFIESTNSTTSFRNGEISDDVLLKVLDRGNLIILDYITDCEALSTKTISRLKEYSETVEKVPYFLAKKYKELELDYSKYTLDGLLLIFNETLKYDYDKSDWKTKETASEKAKEIYKMICERLKNGESFSVKQFEINLKTQFINFDPENKKDLVGQLIDIVGLNKTIIESIDENMREYEELILSKISNQANLKYLSEMPYRDFNIKNFFYNDRILKKLINLGYLDAASNFSYFESYVPQVIEKIKNGDPAYKDTVVRKYYSGELFQLLLERNMVEKVDFFSEYFNNNPKLLEIVLKRIKEGKTVNLRSECYEIEGLLDAVIKNRNFAIIQNFYLNNLKNAVLTDESVDIIIEAIKSDFVLANKMLERNLSLVVQNKKILHFYLKSNSYFIEKTIEQINHREDLEYLYNGEVYNLVKEEYAKKYSLNLTNLDCISTKFGMRIIRYLDNEILHQLVNLPSEDFEGFIALFSDKKLNLTDLANIYDSIIQYRFSKEQPEVVEIFADIMHSLDDHSDVYIYKIEELKSVIGDKFYAKFGDAYPSLVDIFKENPDEFMLYIINKIQNDVAEREEYIEVLHFITNYYIANKRELYRKNCNMYKESSLEIPYDLDEKDIENKLVIFCLNDRFHKRIICDKLIELGLDRELADRCILYYLSKKDKDSIVQDGEVRILDGENIIFNNSEVNLIKKHLRDLSLISREYIKIIPNRDDYIKDLDSQGLIARVYKMPENDQDIYQLLTTMNIVALKNTLSNPEAYNSLLQAMHKYRLHFIPSCFKLFLESENIGISGDYSNIGGFITYYDKIYEAEKSRLESQGKFSEIVSLTPSRIFIYSEVYSSVSSVYFQILGVKDARLIKSNPGPNSATEKTSGNTRLNEAVERTVNNFNRMAVTVPTFAENVSMDNGKSMYVVVGNFTNPSNLTHGERTGACMRIGGVGESLFQFCLDNENGFHIRFENPTTGEYISRVSGFRNGNTVFLNELRYSCNQEAYSNEDVVEACRKVAEMLIERSKDSSCPIDNVVIHQAYAVRSSNCSSTYLGVSSIKTGLTHFYSDVSSTACVLATSSTTSSFVPINFDKSEVPTYLPAREKARESTDLKEIIDMINRVAGVKALLAGQSLDSIEPEITDTSLVYGIASNDWYIYIDSDLVIHENIISIDERAKGELEIARKRAKEMLPTIEKQQAYNY